MRIPVSSPVFLGREREYVLDCLHKVQLTNGSYVHLFEEAFADFCGVKHAVSCVNGTAALHLAMIAHDVRPGDHVLMPALTYVATANAVAYCGGVPVFCDVDPNTWCIDPEDVRKTLDRLARRRIRPVGIIAVHLYGSVADMMALRSITDEHRMWLVEDAAEAHGATYEDRRVGGLGNMTTFSFYGNKIITTGEGGMVTTDNEDVAAVLRTYRGQGVDPNRRYWHDVVGYNYRMANIPAAIGLAQLEKFELHQSMRMVVFQEYVKLLNPSYITQGSLPESQSANWMMTVLVPKGVNRDAVMKRMEMLGVETRPVFYVMTSLPPYQGIIPPIAGDISDRGINLPTYATLTPPDIRYVVESFERSLS